MTRPLPLTARFLLLVLVVVVAPLALMGYWLAGTAARSGEELLRSRLRQTNARATAEMASNWLRPRSALLSFAEDSLVQETLIRRRARRTIPESAGVREAPTALQPETSILRSRFDSLPPSIVEISVHDATGDIVWLFSRGSRLPTFAVRLPVVTRFAGDSLGELEARLLGDAVVGSGGLAAAAGAVIAILDPETGASLSGLPFDPTALAGARFEFDGEVWIAERRVLLDPRLDVVSSAPLAEFAAPFEAAASRGLAVLLTVALVATVMVALIARRTTRSLSRLAAAADSVGRGQLDVRLPSGRDEVGRVTDAFNRMSRSLERTLAELAHREALAAVGSFASELAHEVRNPLTSIKVDLQYVEEQLPEGSETRAIQHAVVEEVARLDRTVAGVLQMARSGRIVLEPVDIRDPLRAALRAVEPLAERAGATLRVNQPSKPLLVLGDCSALQQLFTNVIVNAAQAVSTGGLIEVLVKADDGRAAVQVHDDGAGIPAEQLARVRDPFFTTRADGTGLGLAIAERIAAAHHGDLIIESEVGRGTWVSVRFKTVSRGTAAPAAG